MLQSQVHILKYRRYLVSTSSSVKELLITLAPLLAPFNAATSPNVEYGPSVMSSTNTYSGSNYLSVNFLSKPAHQNPQANDQKRVSLVSYLFTHLWFLDYLCVLLPLWWPWGIEEPSGCAGSWPCKGFQGLRHTRESISRFYIRWKPGRKHLVAWYTIHNVLQMPQTHWLTTTRAKFFLSPYQRLPHQVLYLLVRVSFGGGFWERSINSFPVPCMDSNSVLNAPSEYTVP